MSARRVRHTSLILVVALFVPACAMGFAAFDPDLEQGAVDLQAKVSAFFDRLEKVAGTEAAAWPHHAAFYEEARGDVASLRAKAALQPGNGPTVQSLDLLGRSLAELEALHSEGLSAAELPTLRKLIDTQIRMVVRLEAAKRPAPQEVRP